jgi:redox-sensing transcriptional repressor
MEKSLPDVVVRRVSLYVRELRRLEKEGRLFVSSATLAACLGFSAAQIRRDLSSCGQFGTSGRGYDIRRLRGSLSAILGIDCHTWSMALAGVGNLGSALLAYQGFRERGFRFCVAFDADPAKVGQTIHGVPVEHVSRLTDIVQRDAIRVGVIAVPSERAQDVCDAFVQAGVHGIVNFAPTQLTAPAAIQLRHVDMSLEFEQLTYYLVHERQLGPV